MFVGENNHPSNFLRINFSALLNSPDTSMAEQSDSTEAHSSSNDTGLSDSASADQSGALVCGERQAVCVAEAALQDGENKKAESAAANLTGRLA